MREPTRRAVWILAGGICCLCKGPVLDQTVDLVSLGEVAHAAGSGTDLERTPRYVSSLSEAEKDHPDNLLLLCPTCHTKVDNKTLEQAYDLETVLAIKQRHEQRVRELLDLIDGDESIVARVVAAVPGRASDADRRTVSTAVTKRGRVPIYMDGVHRNEIEIDLRGQDRASPHYWDEALRQLRKGVARLAGAVQDAEITNHVSLVAFAPQPLLIALGMLIADAFEVDVLQRSRTTEWDPDPDAPAFDFAVTFADATSPAEEAVVVLGLSGAAPADEFPDKLSGLLTARLDPKDSPVRRDINDAATSRHNLDIHLTALLGELEHRMPRPEVLHIVTAAPLYANVQLGRVLMREISQRVVLYERDPATSTYLPVLGIDRSELE